MRSARRLLRPPSVILVLVVFAAVGFAQQNRGSLRGLITDELGAAIVGANVTLTDTSGTQKKSTTNGEGVYSFAGLLPGKYTLQAEAPGFTNSGGREVTVTNQRQSLDLTLKVTIEERVTVNAETPVSTEANANANQQVIGGKDLDALPEDPDELAAALQALAGPQVGPNGGQIFVDGFSGNALPSKDSIREIRINQNPFAAENDQPSGRIDILTRPGTDKLRGSASFNFNDESLNSRNPFSTASSKRTPFQLRQYNATLSGPIVAGKASYFVNYGRFETDDNELVNATVLDSNLNPVMFGQAFLVPRRNTNFGPRFDYAINTNNTLVSRYFYNKSRTTNQGIGGFSLPERAYDNVFTSHNFQITETAILNPTTITETRFQVNRSRSESFGDSTIPVLNVSSAFISGGSQVGHSTSTRTSWELGNFTAKQMGTHAIKFGGRIRGVKVEDVNPNNFGGAWFFTGGFGLTSIQRYQLTLEMQAQGRTPEEIRAAGGGASQFTINVGDPNASVSQSDYGFFIQDDWRVRPNLTLSYGLRYETQTNAASRYGFAPRAAVAWSPGAANSAKPPKMVIRAGGGVFYNRFNEGNTLTANRYDGSKVVSYALTEVSGLTFPPSIAEQNLPNVAPLYDFLNSFNPATVPPIANVPATQATIWRVDPDIQTPTVYVLGTQVERQLPRNITMYAGFYNIFIQHVIRIRDVNAPLPGTIIPIVRPGGLRPDPTLGEIYRYEASANFHQRQLFIGFNTRLSRSITLNGNYSLSKSTNDGDGQGSQAFPMNSYDASNEFGRSGFDTRHRFSMFGSITLPWWKVVLNPFIIANTGPPFNITTGQDLNLDRQYNERPSIAAENADCNNVNIRCTKYGKFNLRPLPGEQIIPRNYGQSPGSLSVNLTVSRSFQFGLINKTSVAPARTTTQSVAAGGDAAKRTGAPGGPSAGGGGAANAKAPVAPGSPGPQGGGSGGEKRYNLTVSINFQNILNKVNLGQPVGNLLSPSFGESLGLAGSFGGFGAPGGSSGAGNRRISAQVRLNF